MKFTSTFFLLTTISLQSFSQSGEWAWMKGDSTQPANAVWGIQGVGNPNNTPASKYSYHHWLDSAGNLWIYGGVTDFTYGYMCYNDVWKFDITTLNWIWMQGDTTYNTLPEFGVQGIPSPNNTPGYRYFGGLSWTGLDGKFWITGGNSSSIGDVMMMYDPSTNEWTWMSGTPGNINAFFGTMGVASPNNTPGFTSETNASWVDDDGNFWFYGGQDAATASLWKYDGTTLLWTWMSGDSTYSFYDAMPVYGTKGIPNANNKPGQRSCYASWKDDQDNFWLFGGTYSTMVDQFAYNDVWKYNPSTNEWTWMSGDSVLDQYAVSGNYCEFSDSFNPGARWENRACLPDTCGNVWMYGGAGPDYTKPCDLWIYRPQSNDWALVISNSNPHYGTKGVPDVLNSPASRMGSITWFDHEGNMWLFGGITNIFYGNDLWKYIPDQECLQSACIATSTNELLNSINDLKVYPNPSFGIFTLEIAASGNLSIEIRNVIGQQIFSSEEKNIDGNFKKQIDLTGQASGIYFLQVKNDERQWVQKILIE